MTEVIEAKPPNVPQPNYISERNKARAAATAAAAAGIASLPATPLGRIWTRLSAFLVRIYFMIHLKWVILQVRLWNWIHYFKIPSNQTGSNSADDDSEETLRAVAKSGDSKPSSTALSKTTTTTATTEKPRLVRRLRKIVHIGDEVALGVGDWVRMFGASGVLQYVKLQPPLLLSTWEMLNEAKYGATTADWMPGAALFESNFNEKTGRNNDASIVMVTLGSNDTCSPSTSVDNMMEMCCTIRQRMPECVVMFNIPPNPYEVMRRPDDSAVKKRVVDRNEALRAALRKGDFDSRWLVHQATRHREEQQERREAAAAAAAAASGGKKNARRAAASAATVSFAPDVTVPLPARIGENAGAVGYIRVGVDMDILFSQQESVFTFAGLHLKPRGYKEAARHLGPMLLLAQRFVEADQVRGLLDVSP